MRRFLGILICLAALVGPGALQAQEIIDGVVFSRFRQFRIPFDPPQGGPVVKQLQLFVSIDNGRSWQPRATAAPEEKGFRFFADRDGSYWFTVQTIDTDGKSYPPVVDNAQPGLRMVVDTVKPTVTLRTLPPQNGQVGVAWESRDDNLDLTLKDAFLLEQRPAGTASWLPLRVAPGQQQYYWNPNSSGLVEVRLRVSDRARNWGEALTTVSLYGNNNPNGGNSSGSNGLTNPGSTFVPITPEAVSNANANAGNFLEPRPQDVFNAPPASERKFVNNTRVTLHYNLENLGPSGISYVELWYTLDGRTWSKYPVKFGEDSKQRNITFDVAREGLYGITLVAKSGVGLGDQPPKVGDRPQVWIEVDTAKPVAKLHNVIVGQGIDKGKMTLLWAANDTNLTRDPVALSYSESASGPWTPIAQKLTNTGRYVWNMPDNVPYQVYVRLEARDLAENVGESITEQPIKVDLAHPRAIPLRVEPAN